MQCVHMCKIEEMLQTHLQGTTAQRSNNVESDADCVW